MYFCLIIGAIGAALFSAAIGSIFALLYVSKQLPG